MASHALLIPQLAASLPSFAFNGSRASLFLLLPVELTEMFGDYPYAQMHVLCVKIKPKMQMLLVVFWFQDLFKVQT